MTRKDYIRLAEDLRIERRNLLTPEAKHGFYIAVSCFCDAAKRNNPNFDRDKFWAAVEKETS